MLGYLAITGLPLGILINFKVLLLKVRRLLSLTGSLLNQASAPSVLSVVKIYLPPFPCHPRH